MKLADLQKKVCQINGSPLDTDRPSVIAASPFQKDGMMLKRIVLRAIPKNVDDVEFAVHTELTEERFRLPNGTIDATDTKWSFDNGDYTPDFERGMEIFVERAKCLVMGLAGVA